MQMCIRDRYTKYIEDALENVYEDKYLVKEDVEPLKADGERKSFNELHMPYEINNIVTLMKKDVYKRQAVCREL